MKRMKYLKSKKDYNYTNKHNKHKFDIDKVVLECKDILMELVDDGIEVSVYESVLLIWNHQRPIILTTLK